MQAVHRTISQYMVIWRLLNSRQCNDTATENIRGSKAGGWPAYGRYWLLVLQS